MAEEASRLSITHAGFALTSLPHKRTLDRLWRKEGYRTTLLIESGSDRAGELIGVPYGSVARLILLYLQSEAIRTNSPEVELGRSMNSWLSRMNIAVGGRTYNLVSQQARRISACRLTFFADREGIETRHNGSFIRDAITLAGVYTDNRVQADSQATLWQDRVRLDDGFWRSLREHPVPVREDAIKAIGTRSLAIDVYIWLAYRLHSLGKPAPVSWLSLHSQFGSGFKNLRQFKPTFMEALNLALAVYPEADVSVESKGLTLRPSTPAVPKVQTSRLTG